MKDEHALQSYFVQRIGEVPERARPAADRLGRDSRRRPRAERDRDVLARHRGRDRGGGGGSRRRAVAGADAVLRQSSAEHGASAGRGPVVSVEDVYRFDPAPAALTRSAARAHSRRAGEPLDRARPHRGSRRVHDVSARRGDRGGRLVAGRRASTGNRSRRGCPTSSRAIERSASASRARPSLRAERPGHRTSHELASCSEQDPALARGRCAAAGRARRVSRRHHESVLDLSRRRPVARSARSRRRSGRCRSISRSATT